VSLVAASFLPLSQVTWMHVVDGLRDSAVAGPVLEVIDRLVKHGAVVA